MNIAAMIEQLRSERAIINKALTVLTRLGSGGAGRQRRNRTRTRSAETRGRMSEGQRRRWAAYRRAKAGLG
jgi:hypothetical protein